jgi:hypothetical protein
MAVQTKCPECARALSVADELVGKKVRCKGCGASFVIRDPKSAKSAAPAKGPAKAPAKSPAKAPATATRAGKPPPRRVVDEDDDEEEDDRPKKRKKKKKKASSNTTLYLILGGVGLVVIVIATVVILLMSNRSPRRTDIAAAPKVPTVIPDAPVPPPKPPAPVPVIKVDDGGAPAGTYGDYGNEPVAAADPGNPDLVLRSRADDTFYRLSNPRINPNGNNIRVTFDCELVRIGKHKGGATMVYHTTAGRTKTVPNIDLPFTDKGEKGELFIEMINVNVDPDASPENAEFYLVRSDPRYGDPPPMFKVSNTAVTGTMQKKKQQRNWTNDEIARYTKDPSAKQPTETTPTPTPPTDPMVANKEVAKPATKFVPTGIYLPNQSKVGVDTEIIGLTEGLQAAKRYVNPTGNLLGVVHNLPKEANGGEEPGMAQLEPVFGADREPLPGQDREMAREGYAVSGIEISYKTQIHAFRLHYRRLKPDGSLDARDVYSSQWVGIRLPGAVTRRVDSPSDSRVLGISTYQPRGFVVAVSLVLDKKTK